MSNSLRLPLLLILVTVIATSCTSYGTRVSKDYLEIYYKDGITDAQADKTLNYLYPLWKSDSINPVRKSIQLTKEGDTIVFHMVADTAKAVQLEDTRIYITANEFSKSIYNNAPVNIVLADNKFKTLRVFHYKEGSSTDFGRKSVSGNIEVYSPEDFSEDLALKLAQFIDQNDNSSNTKSFRLDQDANGVYVVQMVIEKGQAEPINDADFYGLAKLFSENVFSGSGVSLELTDNTFVPFKTLDFPVDTTKTEPTVTD